MAILCDLYQITGGSAVLECNNNRVVKALQRGLGKVGTSRKDCDITRATLRLLEKTPITVTFEEVNGHLNKVVSYESLTMMEHLNVDCD